MYADYAFYTTEYHGRTVCAADFDRLVVPAGAHIDRMTFGRARTAVDGGGEAVREIKLAECAAVEALHLAESHAGIASESVGKHTVTYTGDNASHSAAKAARVYLSGTGLLYPGV